VPQRLEEIDLHVSKIAHTYCLNDNHLFIRVSFRMCPVRSLPSALASSPPPAIHEVPPATFTLLNRSHANGHLSRLRTSLTAKFTLIRPGSPNLLHHPRSARQPARGDGALRNNYSTKTYVTYAQHSHPPLRGAFYLATASKSERPQSRLSHSFSPSSTIDRTPAQWATVKGRSRKNHHSRTRTGL